MIDKELLREAKDSTTFCTAVDPKNAFDCMGVLFKWVDIVDSLLEDADTTEDLSILVVEPLLILCTSMVNEPERFSAQERGKLLNTINNIRQARTADNAIELKQQAAVLYEGMKEVK